MYTSYIKYYTPFSRKRKRYTRLRAAIQPGHRAPGQGRMTLGLLGIHASMLVTSSRASRRRQRRSRRHPEELPLLDTRKGFSKAWTRASTGLGKDAGSGPVDPLRIDRPKARLLSQ